MLCTVGDRIARRNPTLLRCASGRPRGNRGTAESWRCRGCRVSSYEPRPGTVAYRVLAYLETLPKGAEVTASRLAEEIGTPADNIRPCMQPAINAGAIFVRQKDEHVRSPFWYSLTDHSSAPRAPVQRLVVPPDTPPQGANRDATGFEGRGQQWPDATDCKARGKVISPEASASATGRGGDAPIARGAAPVSSSFGDLELHMVVRVTHAQAEAIVQLLQGSA